MGNALSCAGCQAKQAKSHVDAEITFSEKEYKGLSTTGFPAESFTDANVFSLSNDGKVYAIEEMVHDPKVVIAQWLRTRCRASAATRKSCPRIKARKRRTRRKWKVRARRRVAMVMVIVKSRRRKASTPSNRIKTVASHRSRNKPSSLSFAAK